MINTDSLHICMFVQLIGVTGAKAKRRGLADWFSLDESEIFNREDRTNDINTRSFQYLNLRHSYF